MQEEILFPYENIRSEQHKLIADVQEAITSEKNLLVHAPTGLGKTVAALGPALKEALANDKTVFFLTSRNTQHLLAVKTVKDIMEAFNTKIVCCDIIAKKWMCSQPGAESMPTGAFYEYCKSLREDNMCDFYSNTRSNGKPSIVASKVLFDLKERMPLSTEEINSTCREKKLCPYEVASMLAAEAHIVIADYNYLFNEKIRESFFRRSNKSIEKSIIIIDEGHNLPARCRDMQSSVLSLFIIQRAIQEAKKYGLEETQKKLGYIEQVVIELGSELTDENNEEYVLRREFEKKIDSEIGYELSIEEFESQAKVVREEIGQSFIGSVSAFLELWRGPDRGYCRSVTFKPTKTGKDVRLMYTCLDPSLVAQEVINNSSSTILMSGTLNPPQMYADLLGFRHYSIKEYSNPFSRHNRLSLVIDEVTTKYTARSPEQYQRIAAIVSDIVNAVPGNSLVFFPSYELRNQVHRYCEKLISKTIFLEMSGISKEERAQSLEKFKSYQHSGAVMLGVAQGSFGEGIDLPGDLLKCVVVVGVPLTKPDLITKDVIEYYDDKFGEGMNYGYIYPAITRTLQNAGRCIRSEHDRGAIIFMDARYSWENYTKCFPSDWDIKMTRMYKERIEKFFGRGEVANEVEERL